MGDGKVWGEACSDLTEIQDIIIWPFLVAWPAATALRISSLSLWSKVVDVNRHNRFVAPDN